MHIQHVEIGNFRKLKAVRIDFSEQKTVFVGANNSGKTSAMVALRRFLVEPSEFTVNDLTLSHWTKINEMAAYSRLESGESVLNLSQLRNVCTLLNLAPAQVLGMADQYEVQLGHQGVNVISEKPTNPAAVAIGLGLLAALLLSS